MAVATSELIVSVSGIRGMIGSSLTPEAATRFACALGTYLRGGRVVLGRDSRPSGEMLKHAVIAGLTAAGCTVSDVGIVPTPTVGVAVRRLGAVGGIMITASHNPAPWNGLKMFGDDGAVLTAAMGAEVRAIYESGAFQLSTWDKIGTVGSPPDVAEDHLQAVLDCVSVAQVASQNFAVFLDGNGGAGGPLGCQLLQALGCQVVQHNCEANGDFVHDPEPTPAHLVDVAPWVEQTKSAVGFVLDPDSDRLALIDERGQCVSEELTLALAIKYRLRQATGPVVVNMSTSRVNEDIANAAGCEFLRSAVGEANVVELIRSSGAVIGGEGNGGVIDPRIGWVRDPFIGMAMILSLMAEDKKPISQLVAELPPYAMLKTKFAVNRDKLAAVLAQLETQWPEAKANRLDGLRLNGPDWWLHIRPSNTEPVVRIIAEAPTMAQAETLCLQAGAVLNG
ncbi:MAG: phosphoglucosamine mutase [Fimbriiglobus sp.]